MSVKRFAADHIGVALLMAVVFIAMLVFFTQLYPIYILDTDDWHYSYYERMPLPLWGDWNPTRVLPELLMPLCGRFAAAFVYPLTGSYFDASMYVMGVCVSVFITIYVACFYRYMRKGIGLEKLPALVLSALFISMHFLIFMVSDRENLHLLFSEEAITYYVYTIPATVNCSLVLLHLSGDIGDIWHAEGRFVSKAFLIIVFYFALLSNLFASAIVGVYAAVILSQRFVVALRGEEALASFFKRNIGLMVIIVVWLVVQVFEAKGGRAGASSSGDVSFLSCLKQCFVAQFSVFANINVVALLTLIAMAVLGCCHVVRNRDDSCTREVVGSIASLGASFVLLDIYLCLLSAAVASSRYILRPDVEFGLFFFAFVILFSAFALVIKAHVKVGYVLPVLLLVTLLPVVSNVSGFRMPNLLPGGGSPDKVMILDNYIFDQIVAADERGETSIEIHVPKFDSEDNWPLALYAKYVFGGALKAHNVTKNLVDVTIVEDEGVNAELGIQAGPVEKPYLGMR